MPFTSAIAAAGGWPKVFAIAAILNFAAAALALLVLKPLRVRMSGRHAARRDVIGSTA